MLEFKCENTSHFKNILERRLQVLEEETLPEETRVVNFRTGTYLRENSFELLGADYFMNLLIGRFSFKAPSNPRPRFLRQSSSSPSSGLSVPSYSREILVMDDGTEDHFHSYGEFLELKDVEHHDEEFKFVAEHDKLEGSNSFLVNEGLTQDCFFNVVSAATKQAALGGSTLLLNIVAVDGDTKPPRAKGYIRKGLRDRLAAKAEEARRLAIKSSEGEMKVKADVCPSRDFTKNAVSITGSETRTM